jgi:cellulose synthase/poly-beta-1,6-N-acetylglucosamine synthase-like glycosyltransferase
MILYENRNNLSNPKPKKLYSVSIVVPAFSEEGRIKKTVESLLSLNYPKHLLEVLLIDDGSKDNTFNEMKEFASSRVRVFHKTNGGKASALNYGIEKARGEIIVSLDADSFVDKNALINMIGYFNNPKVMAVTPSMKVWKPKSLLQKIQFVEYLTGIFLRKVTAFLGCIHVTPGPFSAYRKSFFGKYGGYQEGNLTEDIEVALRIQSNNFEIENSHNAYSYTIAPSRFMPLFKQRLRWYLGFLNNVWNYRHLFSKKYGTLGLFYLPSAFISVIFAILMTSYAFKIVFRNVFKGMGNLFAIDFDFIKMMNFKFDMFYISPGLILMISIFSMLLLLTVVYLGKRLSEDKERLTLPLILSVFLYAPLYALWWAASIAYKTTGKTMKWSGVSWKKD